MLTQLEFALDVIPQNITIVEFIFRLRGFQLERLVHLITNYIEKYPGFGYKRVNETNLICASLDFILRNEK